MAGRMRRATPTSPIGATGGAPVRVVLQGGACNNATAAPGWDTYATDPVATCVTGTVLTKGVLRFDHTNTCTSTTATSGCAFIHFPLPADFPSAGRIDANLWFTNSTSAPDLTAGHTVIWTIATICTRPLASGANTDNPAAMNTPQAFPTFTNGASEAAQSTHSVSLTSLTTGAGCQGGDTLWLRVGRNVSDTVTSGVDFKELEVILYLGV